MASPKSSGTKSLEYRVFRSHFSEITAAIDQEKETFVNKAFEKYLISSVDIKKDAQSLTLKLSEKIKQDCSSFHTFMEILGDLPLCDKIHRKLQEACVSYTSSPSSTATVKL